MRALCRLIWSICCLEAGPERMPYSPLLFMIFIICQFCLVLYQFSIQPDIQNPIVPSVTLISIFIVFIWGLLQVTGKRGRFLQTASSLFAINIFINLLHLPLFWFAERVIQPTPAEGMLFMFTLLLLTFIIVLNIWLIMITAHIFAKAIEKPFLTGLLVTIAMLGMTVIGFAIILN